MSPVTFVTREAAEFPAARVRCHGFARALRNNGIPAEVFSYADDLGAGSGAQERFLTGADRIRLNLRAACRLASRPGVIVLQRFNYHSFAPLLLNAVARRPLIFDLDDWEAREQGGIAWHGLPHSKAEWGMQWCARRSVCCIAASRFLADYVSQFQKNVLYIPTGVDIDAFTPPAPGPIRSGMVTVSWMGTMHRPDNVANIRFAVECFRRLAGEFPETCLEIRGDGIYAGQVRDYISRCDDPRIRYRNWISPAQVPGYLRQVDIGIMPLIQPSFFNRAKSPTRLFEYMACGIPVVASNRGEAAEIIRSGESGFLADDASDFIEYLSVLLRNPQLRRNMGAAARERVVVSYSLPELVQPLSTALRAIV